jgi:hypothetical protein
MTRWRDALIVLLLILNGALVYRILSPSRRSHPAPDPREHVARADLPDVALVDRDGRPRTVRELTTQRPLTLLIVFSPSDCPPCLEEKTLWGEVVRRNVVAVYGIASSPSPEEFWQWESRMEIPVDVYLDTTFAFADSMGFRVTPLKLLISPAGTVLWVDPPRLSPAEVAAFWEDFSRVVDAAS